MASGKSTEYQLAIKIAGKIQSSFNSAMGAARKSLSALGTAATKAAQIGALAMGTAATAAVAFGKSSVETGMGFDKAMAQVAATMGKTVDQIGGLRQLAIDMGSKTAFSATQAADALNYMALAGYDAETSTKMLPNVLNLAAAGGMELATASDMITDSQSALGLTIEQTTALVDQMARASSKSNTSVAQLGEAILTVGGTAQYMAGGTKEINTVLGVLADNGIKGAEGGTHLRNILLKLSAPTADATKLLKKLGVQVFDAEGNMRSFADFFPELNKAMSGMTDQEKLDAMSTLFNSRDIASATALLSTTTERWDELGNAIMDSKDAADAMAKTQLDNLAGDITLWQSAVEGAQIAISDKLTPALRGFVQFGTSGVTKLTEAFQSGGLTGAMGALGGVLSEGLNMVVAQVPAAMDAGMQLLGALGQGLLENLPAISDAAVQTVVLLVNGITKAAPALMEGGVQAISQLLNGIWKAAPTLVTGAAQVIRQAGDVIATNAPLLASGLVNAIPQFVSMAGELLGAFGKAILQNLPVLAAAAVTIMTGLGTYLKENLPSIIASGLEFVKSLTASIRENAGLLVDGAISLALSLAQGLADSLPVMIQNIPQIVSNIANTINDNAPKLITAALNIIVTLGKGLIAAIPTLIANIPQILRAIVDALLAFNWINLGSSIIKGLGSGLKGALSFLKNIGGQIVEAIKGGIRGLPQAMLGIGKNIIQGLWSGIQALGGWIKSKIVSIGEAIVGAIKSFFGINSPSTVFAEIGQNLILGLLQGIQAIWNTIVEFFAGAVEGLLSFFSGLWTNIQSIWSAVAGWFDTNVVQPLVNFFAPIVERVSAFFQGCWTLIQSVWALVSGWFDTNVIQPTIGFFSAIPGAIGGFFSSLWTTVQGIWSAVASWFDTTVVQPLVAFFSPIVQTVTGFFSTLWSGIQAVWSAVSGWFNSTVIQPTVSFFSGIVGTVGGFFSSLWTTIQGVWTAAASWFDTTVIQPLINFFSPIVETVGGFFTSLWDNICAVWQAAGSWFDTNVATPINNAFQSVSDFVTGVFNGLSGVIEGVINKVGGFINGIADGISNVAGKVGSFLGITSKAPEKKNTNVSIPRMATGGIATAPTIAQIGEGGEPEAVLPLSKLTDLLASFAGAVPQAQAAQAAQAAPPQEINTLSWLRYAKIPALAEGGIAKGPTIAQVGEAGDEAIIPLGNLWGQLQEVIAETMNGPSNRIGTLAEQMETAEAAPEPFGISELLDGLTGGKDEPDNDGPQPMQVSYSPVNHYHFEGGTPDRDEIAAAEADDQERFFRYIRQYEKERARSNFRG